MKTETKEPELNEKQLANASGGSRGQQKLKVFNPEDKKNPLKKRIKKTRGQTV